MKALLLSLLFSSALMAVQLTDSLEIRGYGKFDATLNTSADAGTMLTSGARDTLEENVPNYNNTLLGAQLNWNVSQSVDVMVQGLYSKQEKDKPYEATLEWAMLGYTFADDYRLRVGKMKVPFMRWTEVRYVGYAFLWARPQISLNGVNGFDDLYGADLIKSSYFGGIDWQWQLTAGQADHRNAADENKYLYNVAAVATYDDSWVRLSFGQTVFDHIGEQGELLNSDTVLTFVSAETELHMDALAFYGGLGFNRNDAIPNDRFYYGSLAYALPGITPYLLYSDKEVSGTEYLTLQPQPVGPPPPLPPDVAPPQRSRDGYLLERHHAIGVRTDLINGVALKAEYDWQTFERKVDSLHGVEKAGANVYTLSLDAVF